MHNIFHYYKKKRHSQLFPLSCLIALLLLLNACSDTTNTTTDNVPSTTGGQPGITPAVSAIGNFQEYALPQTNSGMMRPAIDSQGRIWFGEMGHNYLAVFDPHTQQFQQMTPPHGASGIMGIVAAPDDTIWFAEQYANYIGHYFPSTRTYQLYTLPTITTPDPSNTNATLTLPSAPNDLALDVHGNVWFTEMNADSLGMLNVKSGLFKHYPLSPTKSVQKLNPYGVAIDRQGMVWFTESSNNHIGRLDPNTGTMRFFTPPNINQPLMEIASDAQGKIWVTSFSAGLLLHLDPSTGTFTPYYAPFANNIAGGLYGLLITPDDEVWITLSAENVLARLDIAARHFVYYHIPTPTSSPFGVVVGTNHTFWFTEAGSNKIGMLKP